MAARSASPRTQREQPDGTRLGRELVGLFSVFCGLLFALSLLTFDSRDPWLNHVVSGAATVHNKAGLFGSYVGGLGFDIFGYASWMIPAFLCLFGARRILGAHTLDWWRWFGFFFFGLCICIAGAAGDLGDVQIFARGVIPPGSGNVSSHGGGIVGHMLYVGMVGWLSPTGTFLVWIFCLLLAMQMLTGISWMALLVKAGNGLVNSASTLAEGAKSKHEERKERRLALAEAEPIDTRAEPAKRAHDVFAEAGEPEDELFMHQQAPGEPLLSEDNESAVYQDEAAPQSSISPSSEPVAPHHADEQDFSAVPIRTPVISAEQGNDYVHPLLARPERSDDTTARAGGDDDLPPWVRDIEEGRVRSFDEAPVGAHVAPAPERQPREPHRAPAHDNTAMQRHVASHSGAVQKGIPDIFDGADDAGLPAAPAERDTPPLYAGAAQEPRAEGFSSDDIYAPLDASEMTPEALGDVRPLVSARTAAAMDALREVGEADPSMPLFQAGPGALSFEQGPVVAESNSEFGAAYDEYQSEEQGVAVQPVAVQETPPPVAAPMAQAPAVPAQTVSGPAVLEQPAAQQSPVVTKAPAPETSFREEYEGDIPIFEAPPVEAAQGPGFVEKVITRIKKPVIVPLPSLELLEGVPVSTSRTPREVLENKGRSLMTCLKDFGIQGELVGITPGPVVTMFEIRPAPGVRVSRIANLSDDLALALKAVAVRIQAPVPGTDTVGIEIPNESRETVCLKELLGSQTFRQSKSLLTLAIGKDIAGNAAVADLATMPHLLVAGATGAGKSVGINSIILSILYKARPDQVKLLLVDPKRVEMAIYADLPHLVHPVVTEMQLAKNALEWAVSEMEDRYNSIAKAGVRNITDYNAKLQNWGNNPPEGMEDLRPLPYLVIIIDELADLMLVAAKEVETSIVRLAQLARAAGIHLILATQRPSVDVVTGIIKANFPCRISFQVTSKHDSRTILDTVGAEHLLGKGDMLFKPAGGKFQRMHGAFVSDGNVNAVVDYWKSKLRPEYRVDFADWAPEGTGGGVLSGGGGGGDVGSDPLYNEAVEFVRQQGKASISLIQRKFRIGFNKAARFVEQMEMDGIIGPADGSKPRLVIR